MNKKTGSTLSTTINGSRSCYITAKRIAFLFVGTILGRTMDTSKNILNWFWALIKIVSALAKRQEKGGCLIFDRNIAHLAHRRALRLMIIASAEKLKNLIVQAKLPEKFVFGQYTSPMRTIVLLSYSESRVNVLHIIIALDYFTLVCKVISVLVEVVNFAMVKVKNFCKKKMIAV